MTSSSSSGSLCTQYLHKHATPLVVVVVVVVVQVSTTLSGWPNWNEIIRYPSIHPSIGAAKLLSSSIDLLKCIYEICLRVVVLDCRSNIRDSWTSSGPNWFLPPLICSQTHTPSFHSISTYIYPSLLLLVSFEIFAQPRSRTHPIKCAYNTVRSCRDWIEIRKLIIRPKLGAMHRFNFVDLVYSFFDNVLRIHSFLTGRAIIDVTT